jgi:hypothetical protein
MSQVLITQTKSRLERLSSDPEQFCKELVNALKFLLTSELEELALWFVQFTKGKPELQNCKIRIDG